MQNKNVKYHTNVHSLQAFAMVHTLTMVKLWTGLRQAGTQTWPRTRRPSRGQMRLMRASQLGQPPQLQLTPAQPQRESLALRTVSKTMISVISFEISVTMRTLWTPASSVTTALTSSCRRPAWGYTRSGAIGPGSNRSSLTLKCREARTSGGELTRQRPNSKSNPRPKSWGLQSQI